MRSFARHIRRHEHNILVIRRIVAHFDRRARRMRVDPLLHRPGERPLDTRRINVRLVLLESDLVVESARNVIPVALARARLSQVAFLNSAVTTGQSSCACSSHACTAVPTPTKIVPSPESASRAKMPNITKPSHAGLPRAASSLICYTSRNLE